ncbi:thiamine ABC transporter ATP-binding protein [Aquibium carbonis]|uniref:Thiamine ABC transporter ATP-binding protein n=1 Tax=Aquibium carbonis TaxID=2495581 RepID=A0A3S0AQV7_9HYPH|nr:thiamine ABC transporter ATP-binding protein [Aquibium carbonis]RST84926.1 thiamine ABC transporter ATP-binding protein [Aquibium carbonis]
MTRATGTGGAEVVLDGVEFAWPGGPPMRFDLSVPSGEILALMGPSGSGKSTLLSLIAGFETPSAGEIRIAGKDVSPLAPALRPVSMIFQENNLFAHLDVAANVGLGRSPSLRLSAEDRAEIGQALARVGLAGKEGRLPRELSGGERQRVALARVLVRDRPVLLLDEAFASLGPALRDDMLDLVGDLHASKGMTVIMVTHDPHDARRIASRTAIMEKGAIAEVATTEALFSGERSEALARYLGHGTSR